MKYLGENTSCLFIFKVVKVKHMNIGSYILNYLLYSVIKLWLQSYICIYYS